MKSASGPYNVGGGHLVATVCGLVSYHTVAYGTDTNEALTSPSEAFSGLVFSLAASALVAVTLTTFGTLVTGTNPPAAFATALIVGLGLLSSLLEGAYVMLAVVVLVGAHGEVIYPTAVELGFEPEDPREETADGLFTADIGRDVPENLVVAEDPTAGATGVVHSVVVGVDEAAGEEPARSRSTTRRTPSTSAGPRGGRSARPGSTRTRMTCSSGSSTPTSRASRPPRPTTRSPFASTPTTR